MIAQPAQRRVLYLVHRFPYPPDKGDRIRTFNILKFLSTRCRLSVATLADEPVPADHHATLASYCHRLHVADLHSPWRWLRAGCSVAQGRTVTEGAFASPDLRNVIADWAATDGFDAVLVSSSGMVPYLTSPALQDIPAVVDLIDVDSEKWRQYADATRGPKRLIYQLEARRLRRLEANLPDSVHAVTVVSEPEAELYRQFASRTPVHVIGNGVDLDYFQPMDLPCDNTCVFVGAMDYKPNVDAVVWFAQHVWPAVHRRHPEARFQIVGRNPTPAVRQLATLPGIEVTGAVPDVRPYLARAAVVVAPLQIARGIQNKLLEAMSMGRVVIASPGALDGLTAQDCDGVIAADTGETWINRILPALESPPHRPQLGSAARQRVERDYQWGRQLAPLARLLEPRVSRIRGAITSGSMPGQSERSSEVVRVGFQAAASRTENSLHRAASAAIDHESPLKNH